jgi:hypothetical protein
VPGKRIQLDEQTWQAVSLLASDRRVSFQELANEAFRDLLRKHARPTDLKTALRQSVGGSKNVYPFLAKKRAKKKTARKGKQPS